VFHRGIYQANLRISEWRLKLQQCLLGKEHIGVCEHNDFVLGFRNKRIYNFDFALTLLKKKDLTCCKFCLVFFSDERIVLKGSSTYGNDQIRATASVGNLLSITVSALPV
jgi:hypothetical protein